MGKCDLQGRDCIERNSRESFNCSTTCDGIFSDVWWVPNNIEEEMTDDEAEAAVEAKFKGVNGEELNKFYKRFADLEKEVKLLKSSSSGKKGEELDKEKYKMMIAEYRKFKTKNVKHFRFNSAENSSAFGNL